MKFLQNKHHITTTVFLLLTGFFFFLLRLPSLFEPYWYGDEGIYEVIGYGLRHGRFLYQGIWDNKPPMLYVTYALFSGDQTPVRILSLLFGLGSILAFFFLAKKLFQNQLSVFVATGVFAFLFSIPLLEGNIANAENFMLLPLVLAGLIVFGRSKKLIAKDYLYLFVAGLLLSFAFLYKVVAVFDATAFGIFLILTTFTALSSLSLVIKKVTPLIIGFLLPFAATAGFFAMHHALSTFLSSAFISNVGYVNYGNQFIIPQGFLILKLLILFACCAFLFWKRASYSPSALFIFLWLAFSIFNALFSQRPYTHYVLVVIASFSLLVGFAMRNKKFQIFLFALCLLLVIFIARNFWVYSKSVGYYQNFLLFTLDGRTTMQYQTFFDQATPRDYAIATYINMRRKAGQQIFVWGDSGQIYKLTNTLPPGRYIVAYHMRASAKTLAETRMDLQRTKPTYIVILPNQDAIPYSLSQYRQTFLFDGAVMYERVF